MKPQYKIFIETGLLYTNQIGIVQFPCFIFISRNMSNKYELMFHYCIITTMIFYIQPWRVGLCQLNFCVDDEAVDLIPGIYTQLRLRGKKDADNKTQWSYLLRYFNHSIVHLFFSVNQSLSSMLTQSSQQLRIAKQYWKRLS